MRSWCPGGFGERGIEGKIQAVRYAREHGVPYLGICLGMQLAIVEYGRHVLQACPSAHSTEFNRATPAPGDRADHRVAGPRARVRRRAMSTRSSGGTMRLGAQEVLLQPGTLARELYGRELIAERHRHRYEFNNNYLEAYTARRD